MLENKSYLRYRFLMISLLLLFSAGSAFPQTPSFTYQGRLTDSGTPANGNYDLQFTLWDSLTGGTQIGTTQTQNAVSVSAGIFAVTLNFGATAFPGADRFLEISARPSGAGSFTILAPRQPITSTPYAIRSLNASSADAVIVNGVPGGSGNYVQNTTSQQAGSNFNISGNGKAGGMLSANIVSATQYNIDGVGRVLGFDFLQNDLSVGHNSGELITNGIYDSFVGANAGGNTTSGSYNSFFGSNAGETNGVGSQNTLIGAFTSVGSAGLTNATAIGACARVDQSNSLVLGSVDGCFHDAFVNVGIGTTAPQNTLHVKGGVLVETSGSGGNIGFGTPNSETGMTITKGTTSRFDMRFDGLVLKLVANAGNPVAIPPPTNGIAITTGGNVGIGTTSPAHRLSVIGGPSWTSSFWNGSMEFSNASAVGWRANAAGWHFGIGQTNGGLYFFQTSSELGSTLSPVTYDMALTDGGLVGIGTTAPDNKLTVNGAADKPGGGSWDTFSDERLKIIKGRFTPGLKAVMQLKPLRYEYKPDNALGLKLEGEQVGLSAQAVQKVIPEAVTRNDKGYLLVNNDPILWTMLNAIKEQQAQIQQQQERIKQQQAELVQQHRELDALEKLVCRSRRQARVCK